MNRPGAILSLTPARFWPCCLALAILVAAGCSPKSQATRNRAGSEAQTLSSVVQSTAEGMGSGTQSAEPKVQRPGVVASPLSVALAPHEGTGKLDQEIRRFQDQARSGLAPEQALEHLGWLFVKKARESFDPGYYKVAEQCALALESRHPHSQEALLLRGHVLHNLHQFKEAEPLARQLVAERGLPFDFGLLGDVLMEQGKLDEAVGAYQKMVDLRPDLHSYARGAHLRWLKGKLNGAQGLMRLAVSAASPLDPESAAWVHTRLAGYQFQSGAFADADSSCAAALDFQKDYPPALLLKGRMLLAQGHEREAANVLGRAAELNPLPEYEWSLAEALRALGQESEAAAAESHLRQKGAVADPRTCSLYLATRGEAPETALRLARSELETRQDVFTHDALAWALAASGQLEEAGLQMKRALREGTQDARLFFHAAAIARKAGHHADAQHWAAQAAAFAHTLLPSERQQLNQINSPIAARVSVAGGETKENTP